MDYFNRELAAFPLALWGAIDDAAIKSARERLTARRFLDVEGPFGVGLTAIEVGDDQYREPQPNEAGAVISRTVPVPMLRRSFRLSIRRIASPRRIRAGGQSRPGRGRGRSGRRCRGAGGLSGPAGFRPAPAC